MGRGAYQQPQVNMAMSWRRWGAGSLRPRRKRMGQRKTMTLAVAFMMVAMVTCGWSGRQWTSWSRGGPEVGDGGAHEGVQEGQGDAEGGAVGDGDAAEPDVGCAVGKQAEVGEADGYFGESDADGVGRLVGVGGYRCRDVIAHVEVDHVQSEAVRSLVCEVGRVAQDEDLNRK